jgi:hypothetical protein
VTFDQPIEKLLTRDSSGVFNTIPEFHNGSKTENPEDQSKLLRNSKEA